jgi:hypothetical protein
MCMGRACLTRQIDVDPIHLLGNRSKYRVLAEAWLVKDVLLAMLNGIPTVKKLFELMRVSQPLTFADAAVCAIEGPPGFEVLTAAIAERCSITIVYESGWQRSRPRTITPRLVLEVNGVA